MTELTLSDLPGWTFLVEERSAGIYVARGSDQSGRSVQSSGTDADALLERFREDASKLDG